MLLPINGQAQSASYQQVTSKCYTGPTFNFNNTTGTLVGNVHFVAGVDIPLGHKIVDVIVEVHWSKTDNGTCVATTGLPVDLSHVGFQLQGPTGPTQYLATSAATGAFANPMTTASFFGTMDVFQDTTVFRAGHPSLLPAMAPQLGRDTVAPNNALLPTYYGQDPYGFWSVGGIDDAPAVGPNLCIHSYCITLVTCDYTQLQAICKTNPVVTLDPSGMHVFELMDLDSLSDVSCLLKNVSFNPAQVNCSDVGTTVPVLMTLEDRLDSVAACWAMVHVADHDPPMFVNCFPNTYATRYLDANGQDTIWADEINVVDNCMPIVQEVRPFWGGTWGPYLVFSCVTAYQQFWIRATDASGNQDSCRLVIHFIDTVAPTAICGNYTAVLTTANQGAVTVSAIAVDGGSFDVCPPVLGRWIGAQYAPPKVYTCADIGTDTVQLIVSDSHGNLDTCDQAVITIVDQLPPTAVHRDDTVYLDAFGNGVVYASDIENGSVDTCGVDSINLAGAISMAFGCAHLNSPQQVAFYAFDASGNVDSCLATIYVKDTMAPLANCQNSTAYLNANGYALIHAADLNNSSVDLCTGTHLSFEIDGSAFTALACNGGNNNPVPITLTVLDSFGNSSTCISNVTIIDTIRPIANCAAPVVYLNHLGIAMLYASDLSLGSTDNCIIVDSLVNNQDSFSFDCSNIGINQTVLTVLDAAGNQGSCLANVIVEDNINPHASCSDTTIYLDAAGIASITATTIAATSTDNCSITNLSFNGLPSLSFSCADIGNNTVQLLVEDGGGNADYCTAIITVIDTVAPMAVCAATDSLFFMGTVIFINTALMDAGSSDNCFLQNLRLSKDSFDCPDMGANEVTLIATDASGNSDSCTTWIYLIDTTAKALAGPTQILCSQDSTQMAALLPTVNLQGTWSTSSTATIVNPTAHNTAISNIPIGSSVFYWVISNATCANLSIDSVVLHHIPPSPDVAFAGNDMQLCLSDSITLSAQSTTISQGYWKQHPAQSNLGVTIHAPTNPSSLVSGLLPGNSYEFVWELTNDLCGVHDQDTIWATIDAIPNDLAIAGSDIICSPDTVFLQANDPSQGGGAWGSPSSITIGALNAANSWATDFTADSTMMIWSLSNGTCLDYSSDTVWIIEGAEEPVAQKDSFGLIPDGTTTMIDVLGNDSLTDNWAISIQTMPSEGIIVDLGNGTFEVDLNQSNNNQFFMYELCNADCPDVCDTAWVTLNLLPAGDCYAPNTFTPNRDGRNDYFVIPCLYHLEEEVALFIYNRWGNQVYHANDYHNNWEGTLHDQPLPNGVYFYVLQIEGKQPQQGSIEIKR